MKIRYPIRLRPSTPKFFLFFTIILIILVIILLSLALAHKQVTKLEHPLASHVDYAYDQGKSSNFRPVKQATILDSLEAGVKRMSERRRLLTDSCTAILPQQHLSPREFIISERPPLVFCPVYRAASASWLSIMLKFKGAKLPSKCGRNKDTPSEPPIELIRKHYPYPLASQLTRALATSPSLIIVRHPLDRLLSGYRDSMNMPPFEEFAQQLIDDYKEGHIFTDQKWIPIANFCTPCAAEFTYIAKVETFAADQKFLLLAEPQLADSGGKAQWCHPNRRGIPTTSVLSSRYYATLPVELVRNLAAIYAEDMRLFGYSLKGYIGEQHVS